MAGDLITLAVPARDEYARTVRMTAVALVGRAVADIDALDDVRIAVEEAYIYACEVGGVDDRITFDFVLEDDALSVRVGPLVGTESDRDDAAADLYSRFILESVCDGFEACTEGGAVYLRFTKRLTTA